MGKLTRKRVENLIKTLLLFNVCVAVNAQSTNLDAIEYTTAEVKLVKKQTSPCHVDQSYFVFELVNHLNGPFIPIGAQITTMNLRGYLNGDATKIYSELLYGVMTSESDTNTLVINFTYNPEPKYKISEYVRRCNDSDGYFDYGISYIRWAARQERAADMFTLDAFLQSKFNAKFHLMAERDGKFVFEHDKKKMIAFRMYHDWELAEIKEHL